MEFWGVEVKAGQPLKVNPEVGRVIHISQAALGEGKKEKGNHSIPLHLKINNQNFVVGSLSAENFPQVTFDLVFEKEFELSHDWKNGSVYFCGYSADNPYAEDEDEDEFGDPEDSEDERIPLGITNNGKVESKGEEAKPVASKGKSAKPESSAYPKGNVMVPKKDQSSDDEDDDDVDESDDDEDMMDASDDIDDSEDEDDSEDKDEEPKKAVPNNKRPNLSASKTPIAAKKAKLETPQKTDGKKGGGHTATPYPSKKQLDGKTPANNSNKVKEQTPKSVGKVTCNSCSKTFSSDGALQSHTKAKHAGK